MFSREKFIKERNEALFSLDEKKIRRYCKKYSVTIPRDEEVFWRGIYKAICNVEDAPQEVKEKAMAWLKKTWLNAENGVRRGRCADIREKI